MSALGRAVAATAAMALGFVAVFGTFGSARRVGRQHGAALPSVRDRRDRHRACRPGRLAAGRPRGEGPDPRSAGARQPVGTDGRARLDVRVRRQLRAGIAVVHGRTVSGGHRDRRRLGARRTARGAGLHGRPDAHRRHARGGGRVGGFRSGGPAAPNRAVRQPDQRRPARLSSAPTSRTTAGSNCDCSPGRRPAGPGDRRGRPAAGRARRLGPPDRSVAVAGGAGRHGARRRGGRGGARRSIRKPRKRFDDAATHQLGTDPFMRSIQPIEAGTYQCSRFWS